MYIILSVMTELIEKQSWLTRFLGPFMSSENAGGVVPLIAFSAFRYRISHFDVVLLLYEFLLHIFIVCAFRIAGTQ